MLSRPQPERARRPRAVAAEQERAPDGSTQELRIIRPKLLIPVGKLAMTRFLPTRPLDELIGRAHEVEHAGGRSAWRFRCRIRRVRAVGSIRATIRNCSIERSS